MSEERYTMAELMAEFEKQEKERLIREEEERLQEIERKKQERLAEKEKRHQEYLAEKERRYFADEELTCKKCGQTFIWTEGEKRFFKEKGFFRPSMCKECKSKQKVRVTFHK